MDQVSSLRKQRSSLSLTSIIPCDFIVRSRELLYPKLRLPIDLRTHLGQEQGHYSGIHIFKSGR